MAKPAPAAPRAAPRADFKVVVLCFETLVRLMWATAMAVAVREHSKLVQVPLYGANEDSDWVIEQIDRFVAMWSSDVYAGDAMVVRDDDAIQKMAEAQFEIYMLRLVEEMAKGPVPLKHYIEEKQHLHAIMNQQTRALLDEAMRRNNAKISAAQGWVRGLQTVQLVSVVVVAAWAGAAGLAAGAVRLGVVGGIGGLTGTGITGFAGTAGTAGAIASSQQMTIELVKGWKDIQRATVVAIDYGTLLKDAGLELFEQGKAGDGIGGEVAEGIAEKSGEAALEGVDKAASRKLGRTRGVKNSARALRRLQEKLAGDLADKKRRQTQRKVVETLAENKAAKKATSRLIAVSVGKMIFPVVFAANDIKGAIEDYQEEAAPGR